MIDCSADSDARVAGISEDSTAPGEDGGGREHEVQSPLDSRIVGCSTGALFDARLRDGKASSSRSFGARGLMAEDSREKCPS